MRSDIWRGVLLSAGVLSVAAAGLCGDIWDYEAVNADGTGSHPLVGAPPAEENRVTVEGIALNTTGEILNPDVMYTIFLQDEDDWGGMQIWAGSWWYDSWPFYPPVAAGDRVSIRGLLGDHNGKVFINDRHSSSPLTVFEVTILEEGVGMPEPLLIPSVSACNYFDQTRAGGGELYQTHWCRLNDLEVVSGEWSPGADLVVTDGTGDVGLKLSVMGDFSGPVPTGPFDAIGIFDQEDPELPWHDDYRLWVKRNEHIAVESAAPDGWLRAGWNLISIPNEPWDAEASEVLSDLVAAGNLIETNLYGFVPGDGYRLYPIDFTELHRGEGYWLYLAQAADAAMKGVRAGGAVSIDLAAGWQIIGHPHMEPVPLSSCSVTDGVESLSFDEAAAAGWVQQVLYAYDGSGYVLVQTAGPDDALRPWHAYWLLAYRDGLSLVVPAPW